MDYVGDLKSIIHQLEKIKDDLKDEVCEGKIIEAGNEQIVAVAGSRKLKRATSKPPKKSSEEQIVKGSKVRPYAERLIEDSDSLEYNYPGTGKDPLKKVGKMTKCLVCPDSSMLSYNEFGQWISRFRVFEDFKGTGKSKAKSELYKAYKKAYSKGKLTEFAHLLLNVNDKSASGYVVSAMNFK